MRKGYLGLRSGVCTSFGFLPHIIVLLFFLLTGAKFYLLPLLIFTILAKILGEYFFWTTWHKKWNGATEEENRGMTFDPPVYSHPNMLISLGILIADTLADGVLLLYALKAPLSPYWILLALLLCQAVSAPIQGFCSDMFSRKKSLLFAVFIGAVALVTCSEIISTNPESKRYLTHLFGLSPFSSSIQMLMVLCGKGLLANATVIARASMAEVIEVENRKKLEWWNNN